jgi:predicted RNA polymerase sigma factor
VNADAHRTVAAIWGIEFPKLVAGLSRIVRDIGVAEELAQDAFVTAVAQWPAEGIPQNPGAWLMAVGKRRAIDRVRREHMAGHKHELIGSDLRANQASDVDVDALDDDIGDDLLRLMFISCHPLLSIEARVALTLRLLGGLSTAEIARALFTTETTIAQRIVRAKRTLSEAGVPFEVPTAREREQRLASVLEVIYLIFNEGYAASTGDDVLRPELYREALRLGRVLASLMPAEAEVHGLVALMEIQASRAKARVDPDGQPVLLLEQNRGLWDHLLITRGIAALERAQRLGGALGPYALQAALAACHARARTAEETDWQRIVALYDALAQLMPSPIVELNRAVALGMAYGPQAGLEVVDTLIDEPAFKNYHLLPSVRGDLLEKLNRRSEASAEFERAAELARNTRDRDLLLGRAARCRF